VHCSGTCFKVVFGEQIKNYLEESVKSRSHFLPIAVIAMALLLPVLAGAQDSLPRYEAGFQFTGLRLANPIGESAAGLGGRFGVNFNKYLTAETEFNRFPSASSDFGENEALFGVKLGVRTDSGGIFFKARPGFLTFPANGALHGRGLTDSTEFAFDFGMVAEKYVGQHLLLRLDAGDTVVAYGGQHILDTSQPGGRATTLGTTSNLQISVGVGIRF
jgi:hypothetical protein